MVLSCWKLMHRFEPLTQGSGALVERGIDEARGERAGMQTALRGPD
jgi:hypothetical protein